MLSAQFTEFAFRVQCNNTSKCGAALHTAGDIELQIAGAPVSACVRAFVCACVCGGGGDEESQATGDPVFDWQSERFSETNMAVAWHHCPPPTLPAVLQAGCLLCCSKRAVRSMEDLP